MTREGELYIAQWKHMTEATGRKLADISRARQPATTQRMTAIRYDPATSTGLCMYNDDAPSMNYKTHTHIYIYIYIYIYYRRLVIRYLK
jgi:hypothetical protein